VYAYVKFPRSCEVCGQSLGSESDVLEIGDLRLVRSEHSITWKGRPVPLTPHEYGIVELLAMRPGKVIRKDTFYMLLLGTDGDPKRLDVHVCRVRAKFRAIDPAFNRIRAVPCCGLTWRN
jgi:DNA-binding response OmpR family regulator